MNLKQKLDYHYNIFDRSKIEPDPLQFLHLFNDEKDIEVMGLIASIFAYGSVKQIIISLNKIVEISKNEPYNFIRQFDFQKDKVRFNGLKHRFYTEKDITHLFSLIQTAHREFGSLKNLFSKGCDNNDENVKNGITNFSEYFLTNYKKMYGDFSNGIKFMFPLPQKGSACKRMNLFLRWMVRDDELDCGLWNEIPLNKLIIPVDTHIARICKQLNLTKRKKVNWEMAEEITGKLKRFDPVDPVKYDFALCHIGMRKLEF